jgi:hypothetical protein
MTGLPKFVRDQMAGTPAPSSHPDADVLTAFAENTLTAKERQQVTEHLSACADCREVIFLAQPESVQTQAVLAPKPRRFTRMAWASVAAVIVVVGSAVFLQHEQVTKIQAPVTVATTTTPPSPEAKPTAPPITRDEAMASVSKPRAAMERREADLDAAKTKSATEPLFTTKDIDHSEELVYQGAPVPPAVSNQQVTVAGAAPQQASTGPAQRNISGQIQQAQGPSNTANKINITAADNKLAKAESAPRAKFSSKQRADEFRGLTTGYTAAPAAAPLPAARAHWQISSTRILERSYAADTWTPVLTVTGAKFHVVSVIGNTVWAGGEHGALYVSRDGGTTWNPVTIDTTSTITSVHFSDDLHGTLETVDGQVWKTADNGKTWQKQ